MSSEPSKAEDRFFLKDGYQQRTERHTIESEPGDYWMPFRIKLSRKYQYYVYLYVQSLLQAGKHTSLLDVGCGPGAKAQRMLVPYCNDITLMDQPTLKDVVGRIAPQCKFAAVDLETPETELGRKFDLILCADVLEHLLDPNPALDFIHDHLADGGLAILSTPERDYLRGFDCMDSPKPDHVREWNTSEFAAWVQSRHFEIEPPVLMPQERLNPVEYWWSKRQTAKGIHTQRWSSCQMIIAKPTAREQ